MMDLILDANIFFAALIKESTTSDLLAQEEFHLFAPEFLLQEFRKYESEILAKTSRESQDFQRYFETLTRKITFIPLEELIPYADKAKELSPDPKDYLYFAIALKLQAKIWSNDKRLRNQDQISVLSTADIINT